MLTDKQLNKILLKNRLSRDDLYLLEHHIEYIGNLQDEYGEELPEDVFFNLSNDLEKIIEKLGSNLDNIRKKP